MKAGKLFNLVLSLITAVALLFAGVWVNRWLDETRVLREMIERLSADTRIAEVLVTKSEYNEHTKKIDTTIKFLEYDAAGNSLMPKYFTFQGNIIQFQSLVIRFQDGFIKSADRLKGKSAYLFMKAFVLDGSKTQEFNITKHYEIPDGYKIDQEASKYEHELWENFWIYALDPEAKQPAGIKNAQIEAPGSLFRPGSIYTLRIEHDGGIRIDAEPIPEILEGEMI